MGKTRVSGCLAVIAAMAAIQLVQAQPFNATVGEGNAAVWRAASGEKEQVSGATSISVGDTLFAADGNDAVIQIESNSRILVKGGTVITLAGQDRAVDVVLDEGQIFLDRGRPRQLSSVRILADGYAFVPAGTAVAVKTSHGGAPTVAVLRGSVQMQSADESVLVGPGQFGTVNNNGRLVSGALSGNGIRQLESWSGVKLDGAPAAGTPAGDSHQSAETAQAAGAAEDETGGQPADDAETAGADQLEDAGQQKAQTGKPESRYAPAPLFAKPEFEFSAGVFTSGGDLWTRFMLGIDIPVWRFGVFLDLELFFNDKFSISKKGWDIKNDPAEFWLRKIRYIRYGQEDDPFFVKFGGLSGVTMGYGIVMDGFTNMLHYPDEKLLGLQVNLNDVTPLGISLQTLISDFSELGDDGGVVAARLAVRPLKTTDIPLLNGLFIGGTYARDMNTLAPARKWEVNDTLPNPLEDSLRSSTSSFSVYGFDAGIPVINWDLLNLTLYTQMAGRADDVRGWAYAPVGVEMNLWKLWGRVEYRRVEGQYAPGFFDMYYLDERYSREDMMEKGAYVEDVSQNGIYGRAVMDVWDLLKLEASYQYMFTKDRDSSAIESYEGTLGLGETVLTFIPKINLAEVYIRNSNIGNPLNKRYDNKGDMADTEKAGRFDRSPYMYWGSRLGFEIVTGLSLIFDYRHGWKIEEGKLAADNHIFLHTALRF
ncbi:MAG: FecR family protein [Chitinispirillia bacterium]|nr:FecR family protein [Chitinispirillia bacterium]